MNSARNLPSDRGPDDGGGRDPVPHQHQRHKGPARRYVLPRNQLGAGVVGGTRRIPGPDGFSRLVVYCIYGLPSIGLLDTFFLLTLLSQGQQTKISMLTFTIPMLRAGR